jgi:hypothetical protein
MGSFMQAEPANLFYQIRSQVVVEYFRDGALVLKLDDRTLTELNHTAGDILNLTDGCRSITEVASLLAEKHQISKTEALQDVNKLYEQLLAQKIIENLVNPSAKGNNQMGQSLASRYMHNPDVVLREEDEDGGLLFNPDTNQVKVVNSTGLFIWKHFETAQEVASVVPAIQSAFEDAPQAEVAADVQEFLDEMTQSGFIGTIEPN